MLQNNLNPNAVVSGIVALDDTSYDISNPIQHKLLSKRIQAVPQVCTDMLADNFSFYDNLRFAQLEELPGLQQLPKQNLSFQTFFHDFNISPNQPIKKLSGGQKQICAILMALSKSTRILLLDEPTAALDTDNTQLLMRFIKHIIDTLGITVFMISHDHDIILQQNHSIQIVKDTQGVRNIKKYN